MQNENSENRNDNLIAADYSSNGRAFESWLKKCTQPALEGKDPFSKMDSETERQPNDTLKGKQIF